MSRILVTGATGFLGSHLLHWLRESGCAAKLRVLTRSGRWGETQAGAEVVQGDVCDRAAVREAMRGVSHVYHLAGVVSREPSQAPLLYRTHMEGTRNVCEATLEFGVEKLVLVSSSGTIAVSLTPAVHREEEPFANDVVGRWPYYLSKIFQEKAALCYHRTRALPVVVVNPSLLLGPGDQKGRSNRDVILFLRQKVLAVPPGGLNFVDVRDAAASLGAAMQKGKVGERYFIGGTNWTFAEFFHRLGALSGVKAPRMRLSASSYGWVTRLTPLARALAPRYLPVTQTEVEMASHFWYLENNKARQALGATFRDPDETLRATIEDIRRLFFPSGASTKAWR